MSHRYSNSRDRSRERYHGYRGRSESSEDVFIVLYSPIKKEKKAIEVSAEVIIISQLSNLHNKKESSTASNKLDLMNQQILKFSVKKMNHAVKDSQRLNYRSL